MNFFKIILICVLIFWNCASYTIKDEDVGKMRIITKKEKETKLKQFCKEVGINYTFAWELKKHALDEPKFVPSMSPQENIICFIGDSRTALGDWENNIHVPNITAKNFARSGSTVTNWSGDLVIQAIIQKNPKWLSTSCGGNDLGAGGSKHRIQKIIGDMFKLIWNVEMYSDTEKIFVHAVLPVIQHGKATNKDVCELNKNLKALCKILNISYIDFYNDFIDYKTNWCKLEYLRKEEMGNVPQVLFDALKSNDKKIIEKAKSVLFSGIPGNILWKKTRPVHFSQEGFIFWYELCNNFFK